MSLPMFVPDGAAIRDISSTWRSFMGIPEGGDLAEAYKTLREFGKAPADEAWVFACVRRLYMDAQGVPLVVYRKSGRERLPLEDGDSLGAEIQYLLDNVNDVSMSGSDLKAYHSASASLWGEDYWLKIRGRLGGPPQELHWLRAPDMTPKTGGSWIDSYDYNPTAQSATNYPAKNVIAYRTVNLEDPTRGLSPISSIRYDIAVNRQAALHTAFTLANWGIPAMAWVAPKGAELSPQDQSLIKRALRALRGPRNSGKVPILPEGLEPKMLGMLPKDAEWLSARKTSRMTICAAFGVPLVLVGDDEKAGVYASVRDAERVYWRGTQIPNLDKFADTLNNWLLPDFGKTARQSYEIAFDYSEIEALQAPLEDRKRTSIQEIRNGALLPDEYRAIYRIGGPLKGGNERLVESKLIPADEAGTVPDGTPGPDAQPAVPAGETASALRSVRRLYAQPAVVQYLAGRPLDTVALLGHDTAPAVRSHIATGLSRRYSAAQIVDGVPSEKYPGLIGSLPDPMLAMAEAVRSLAERPAPHNTINVTTPDVHVTTPDVIVHNAAPVVNVDVPKQPTPQVTVNVPAQKAVTKTIERDKGGAIVAITETPED